MKVQKRSAVMVAAGLLLVVAIGIGGWFLLGRDGSAAHDNESAPPGSQETSPAEPLTEDQAAELSRQLSSSNPAVQERALDPALRSKPGSSAPSIVPAGSSFIVVTDTFEAQTDKIASVLVQQVDSAGVESSSRLLLHRVNGKWLIYSRADKAGS